MIDDYAKAMELVKKMESQLPIPVFPKKPLIHTLRDKGCRITSQKMLFINSIVYLGDEGGIGCDLGLICDDKEVLICSLTHLTISRRHPLAKEIRAYQRERSIKLAHQDCVEFN